MEKSHFQWTNFWGAGHLALLIWRREGDDIAASCGNALQLQLDLAEFHKMLTLLDNLTSSGLAGGAFATTNRCDMSAAESANVEELLANRPLI